MAIKETIRSQMILDTLEQNIDSLEKLLSVADDGMKQNILRAIILFSCSGIDAVVKQLIIDTLDKVIERDAGAQERLKLYATKRLKKDHEPNYSLLAELMIERDSRSVLVEMLKKELSYDSLQSAEQLFRVASYFNIPTERLLNKSNQEVLRTVFTTRNVIAHQMDVNLESDVIEYYEHEIQDVRCYVETIEMVSQQFIDEVSRIIEKPTIDYCDEITVNENSLVWREFSI